VEQPNEPLWRLPVGWVEGSQTSRRPEQAVGGSGYARHRPEHTLSYQIIERHYPALLGQLSEAGRHLPRHVRREFEDYLERVLYPSYPRQTGVDET